MALTNLELESALTALTTRVTNAERLITNCISVSQMNSLMLIIQQDLINIKSDITSLKARASTLESDIAEIV